jgi:serine/threonine protein kinase
MKQSLPEPSHVIADKYVVERSLGQGGMGAVYLVSHRITGKKLALKCLLPQYLDLPELVERFLREAQAAGRIQHRHVVDVFDVGRDGSVLYLVMPYLEGQPLSSLLREKALTLDETLAILLRAMEGVAAAHAQGIVHRDLKPDNIFVCVGPSGRLDDPRVLDFGISKLDDEEKKGSLTKSGVLMGTPHYMSFEQLNSQRDIDARADVYAMGCILYEALAGELPYVADSAPALAIRMMSAPPKHLSARRPDLPEALVNTVMKAIERERSERHPSLEALIDELRQFAPDHVSAGATDEVRLSRRMARGEAGLQTRPPGGEDKTLAAPTPPPRTGSTEARTMLTPEESKSRPQLRFEQSTVLTPGSSTNAQGESRTSNTQPQLRLDDESERRPGQPSQANSDWLRWALVGSLLMAAGVLCVWALSGGEKPAPETSHAQAAPAAPKQGAAKQPTEADSDSVEAAPTAGGDEKPKRKVMRKVRRRRPRSGATPSAPTGVAVPAASASKPSQTAAEADAVVDEWEEYEEEVEVEEGTEETAGEPAWVPSGEAPAASPAPSDGARGEAPKPSEAKAPSEEATPKPPAAEGTSPVAPAETMPANEAEATPPTAKSSEGPTE